MIWTETCSEFGVMPEFLRTQGLGLGSRLLRVVGLWLRAQGLGSRLSRL